MTNSQIAEFIHAISHYKPVIKSLTARSAAVMIIILYDETNSLETIITQRAFTLPTYAGHYSLPGGMHDESDHDLYATAQREVAEELNISPTAYNYIGQLNDFTDRYGNLVRPFVTYMEKKNFLVMYKIAAVEIASLYYLPLNKLRSFKDNPDLHVITKRRPSYSYTDNEVFIWGLTAAILLHLAEVIQFEV